MDGSAAHRRGDTLSVPAMVLRAAGLHPDAIAVRDEGADHSYAELARQARAFAAVLRAQGVSREDLIALVLPRGLARVAVTLAAWWVGAAPLFLDPGWPRARLAEIVGEADCKLVIGDGEESDYAGVPLLALGGPLIDPAAPYWQPDVTLGTDDLAYVIPTSGSSGRPKLVEITHGNLAGLIDWHNAAFAVTPSDRATNLAGLGFDAAVWEVWPYLAAGASVALAPERVRSDAPGLRDWLVATGATIAFAPTLLAEQLLRLSWSDTSLRTLLTGGDRLRAAPPAGLPFTLVNNYGPTECAVVACSGAVPADAVGAPAIGTPIAGSYVRILGRNGQPVATGATGAIWIGGCNVGRGYRGDPAATAAAFAPDRFSDDPQARLYRTGDLASWRPDGSIAFHGRADDQLNIRGHRLEPDEVAAVLARHPHVVGAAVKGVPHEDGIALAAYVEVASGAAPGSEELRAFLADHLPDWAVPSFYVRVDALPVTASGKLDRAALPPPSDANRLPLRAFAEPTTPTEAQLLVIMAEFMGGRDVGVDDNFFLLGGHSLLGTQVVLRASERFCVELTLRHLFNAPTVRQLARVIETLVEELVASLSEEEVLLRAHG